MEIFASKVGMLLSRAKARTFGPRVGITLAPKVCKIVAQSQKSCQKGRYVTCFEAPGMYIPVGSTIPLYGGPNYYMVPGS